MKSKNSQINDAKENLIVTLRALAASDSLQVEFDENQQNNFFTWDQNLLIEKQKVSLPKLQKISEENPLEHFRSAFDLAACYLLFHDQHSHQIAIPDAAERKFFDAFEKIRVIALVKNSYRGVVQNILQKIEEDAPSADSDLSLILLEEFFAAEIGTKTQNLIVDLKRNLSKRILREIRNLAQKISDQKDFAQNVLQILEMLKEEQNEAEEGRSKKTEQESKKLKNDLSSFGQENIDAKEEENLTENNEEELPQDGEKKDETAKKISDLKNDDTAIRLDKSRAEASEEEDGIAFKNAYKIFTNKFDEVIFPQKLIGKNELGILRDQLELRLAKLQIISKKMSLKLKQKLLSKQNSLRERDSSRGILDRKKLTRLVIDPMLEDVWISNKHHEYQDTALTILLDNSGSMRGNPIVMSALACEIIAEILEKYAVKTEIIGFTTADWKGGKARKLWESSGRTKNPGRLNELRHIIYKHFNQSFKKAKINLGLMLKEGVLKENIDGEALLFARSRLMQRAEKRKILLVISDGTPVDDSTSSANDSDILADHLQHVINKIEKSSKIEIVGIGIGHSTEEFYRNSIAIKSLEELGDVMIEKITNLL